MKKSISKLDIIEKHIRTSVQMIALNFSPFSTHVVTMACSQLIEDVAAKTTVTLPLDFSAVIKPEYRKRIHKLRMKAYNYFKHANLDHSDIYAGPDEAALQELNEILSIANILGYGAMKGGVRVYMAEFASCMSMKYPGMLKQDEANSDWRYLSQFYKNCPTAELRETLRSRLHGHGLLPQFHRASE